MNFSCLPSSFFKGYAWNLASSSISWVLLQILWVGGCFRFSATRQHRSVCGIKNESTRWDFMETILLTSTSSREVMKVDGETASTLYKVSGRISQFPYFLLCHETDECVEVDINLDCVSFSPLVPIQLFMDLWEFSPDFLVMNLSF